MRRGIPFLVSGSPWFFAFFLDCSTQEGAPHSEWYQPLAPLFFAWRPFSEVHKSETPRSFFSPLFFLLVLKKATPASQPRSLPFVLHLFVSAAGLFSSAETVFFSTPTAFPFLMVPATGF